MGATATPTILQAKHPPGAVRWVSLQAASGHRRRVVVLEHLPDGGVLVRRSWNDKVFATRPSQLKARP